MVNSLQTRLKVAQSLTAIALLAGLALSLQGCVGVVVGGAVVGSMAATDRRTLGAQTEDKEIALKVNTRMHDTIGDIAHIDVTSYNRKVLLTGEVRDQQMKDTAERETRAVQGVQGVMNELEITEKSSLGSRSSDALITSKVEANLIGEKNLNSSAFKVVTERGTVYLLGRVTENEGKIAASLTSEISGVMKVVKMFEYISEDELKSMTAAEGARS
ncbi:MAG: BON domain-containing protein [Burkholderiaceae bacterium]|nr:BON domain-containing protein [Burkholderiaceae bacterium]